MPFYRDYIYPFLVRWLGNPEPIRKIRQQLIPLAQGTVLEVGVGSGANFVHYRPARLDKLYALEPNAGMIRRAKEQQRGLGLNVEYIDLPGERIPLDDRSVDTVVTTFTLCTINAVQDAISEIRRVLKPEGKLIFVELGQSPDAAVQRWQQRLEPVVHRMYAGLHLTRDIPAMIAAGGLKIEHMEQGYLALFPKALTYCWWGTAVVKSPVEFGASGAHHVFSDHTQPETACIRSSPCFCTSSLRRRWLAPRSSPTKNRGAAEERPCRRREPLVIFKRLRNEYNAK